MSPSPDGTVVVAAIGDLHVGEDQHQPYRDLFIEISQRAHVLALCGDLTNFGKTPEAEFGAEPVATVETRSGCTCWTARRWSCTGSASPA